MEQEIRQLYEKKLKELKNNALSCNASIDGEALLNAVESAVFSDDTGDYPLEALAEVADLLKVKLGSRLGPISLLQDPEKSIQEIMVNGPDKIFIEDREGIRETGLTFESREDLEEVIRNIAAAVHREINEMNPILDARLEDGSRVNAVFRNIALDGPVLTIRRFSSERVTMKQLIEYHTLTEECADYLQELVRCGYNIFISGGTSSGKTTFLNALADAIPQHERVIVIEDSRELFLPQISNLVQMECYNANAMGKGKIGMDMLIRASLRMRPDRIIVGEVRGGEVADMLQAFNTGHDGSLSTGHGNSVHGMLRRLEAMYRMAVQIPMDAVRAQIVEGIDVLVHLGRMYDGRRRVLEVQELIDQTEGGYVLNSLFSVTGQGELVRTGSLVHQDKAMRRERSYAVKL